MSRYKEGGIWRKFNGLAAKVDKMVISGGNEDKNLVNNHIPCQSPSVKKLTHNHMFKSLNNENIMK